MGVVPAFESFGEAMQQGIVATLRLYFGDSGEDIVPVCPGSAMTLAYQMDLALKIEAPGILGMAAINQIHQCGDLFAARPLRRRRQRDAAHGFEIDPRHLLAGAQIRDGGLGKAARDPVGDAAAAAATIEAEDEAGLFRSAAMDERIDAKRPMQAGNARRNALKILEARPPHQRAVAEYPKILIGGGRRKVHELGLRCGWRAIPKSCRLFGQDHAQTDESRARSYSN
jgi:hypothetical protein